MKLLSVRGEAMNIFKPDTPSPGEVKAKDYKPDEWPVSKSMIKRTVFGQKTLARKVSELDVST